MKLLYSDNLDKSLYLKTTFINNLISCDTDIINELVIDNSYLNSDSDCYSLAKLLKEISKKEIAVVLNDDVSRHKYLTDMLVSSEIHVYRNYKDIDYNLKIEKDELIVKLKNKLICLSNSLLLKFDTYLKNRNIKKSNSKMINFLKKQYIRKRKKGKQKIVFIKNT